MIAVMKELTNGQFRDGAIARILAEPAASPKELRARKAASALKRLRPIARP